MAQAGALHIEMQLVNQRLVDILGLIGGRAGVGVLDAGAGFFKDVVEAGAGPGAQAQEHRIDKAQRVKPQRGRIDPAVDWNVGRIEQRRLADRGGTAGIAAQLGGAVRG